MKYLKIFLLILFLNFQISVYSWGDSVSDKHKMECWYTTPPKTKMFPRFDCTGKFRKGVSYLCSASISCKNHQDITVQFPHIICFSSDEADDCSRVSPKECVFGPRGIYFSEAIRQMLPDEVLSSLPDVDEIRRVIEMQ